MARPSRPNHWMEDSPRMAPDIESIHDINHTGQNGRHVEEHDVSSVKKENFLEPPRCEGLCPSSTKSHQQNGYHAEMEECETFNGSFKPQIESEDAQIHFSSLDNNGLISLKPHEATKDDSNGDESIDCSLLPANSHEGMQEVTVREMGAQLPVKISNESPVVNQGHLCPLDRSSAVLMGDTMGDENAISQKASDVNNIRGDGDVVSSKVLHDTEKVEGSSCPEEEEGGKETERLDESVMESSTPPCVSTEDIVETDVQPQLSHSVSESKQHENEVANKPAEDLEAASLTSVMNKDIQNELKLSPGEWPDQDCGLATIISSDLEGWQHFDAEEVNAVTDYAQGSDQKIQLWEKLLDDGFDGSENNILNPYMQLAIAPSPFEENQFELASPGNPFMEELARVSSFSEADGFAQNRDLPSSGRLSQSFEKTCSFGWREGPSNNNGCNEDTSSVMATVDGKTNTTQLEFRNERGSHVDVHRPSRKPLSSFDAMEPFEAPSFMSLVDPKSHALFEASMPTFQASSSGDGHGTGGEKWVANFDLMAPSTQEITRSSSMPRSGVEASGQRPGQSFSFATSREQEPSKKGSDSPESQRTKSGLFSPKFSPLVQKVVEKVRTTPAVANGVLNSVRQVVTPKHSDKKSTSKSLLTRCICW